MILSALKTCRNGKLASQMPSGNENSIFFILRAQIPKDCKVTYTNPVCDYIPLKDDPYRVCLTVGGAKLPYANEDARSPTASLLETKLLFNSVISAQNSFLLISKIFFHVPRWKPTSTPEFLLLGKVNQHLASPIMKEHL